MSIDYILIIMFLFFLYNIKIVDFCDNNPFDEENIHNSEAPNKHNRLCDYRSAWEVMRGTADFEGKTRTSVPLAASSHSWLLFLVVDHGYPSKKF